jgi:hypothetical protein
VTTDEAWREVALRGCDQLLAALDAFRARHPRSFHAGLVEARDAAVLLRRRVAGGMPRCSAVIGTVARIERCISDIDAQGFELVRLSVKRLHAICVGEAECYPIAPAMMTSPVRVSHRTRCAAGLAVRLLPPADRQRYREEFAAELADLPRIDQAPYAFRLVGRAWSLRRSLTGRGRPASALVIVVASAGGSAYAAVIDWPAAVLGCAVIAAVMGAISSPDRTRRLASLIRAARSHPSEPRKK